MNDCWPIIQELVDLLHDRRWLTGDNLMWIDFAFFELVLFLDMLSGEVVCQHYQALHDYVERFAKCQVSKRSGKTTKSV